MRRKPTTVSGLAELGRARLSPHFFLRDFLFSDIAAIHRLANVPDDPDLAIATGSRLCNDLLEPLQATFGRIAIRSGYRSAEVNALGNRLGDNCATNATDASLHIWDVRDAEGLCGAMACIIVPSVWDRFHGEGEWRKIAWWIHDHLPYSRLQFFPKLFAFNIAWHEAPRRRIVSFAAPKGLLTKPGMVNHEGSHEPEWRDLFDRDLRSPAAEDGADEDAFTRRPPSLRPARGGAGRMAGNGGPPRRPPGFIAPGS